MPKVPPAYLEARRQAIIEAARQAFVRKGTDATTMADIAREVGITAGAIYRYFPTKDDLIACCFSESEESVTQRWKEPLEAGADPLEQLAELSQLTFSHLNRTEERVDTIIHLQQQLELVREDDTEGLARLRDDRAEITQLVEGRLVQAQERGELPAEVDAALLAEAFISFYWGARLARVLDEQADTDGQLRQLLAVLRAVSVPQHKSR
ncbi:MAG: TetR/AcrR family transcriptional regulator [Dehalococcoidia bacterium]|nr:TetR/AcrR family transcriptional regulator [Dehalococcoidia bacterium]